MAAATAAVVGGVAAAGAVGGAIKGAMGTPSKTTRGKSWLEVSDATPEEQRLQSEAIDQYFNSLKDIDSQQASLGRFQQLQGGALNQIQNLFNGQAFQASPEELALIEQQKQQAINSGSQDINRILGEQTGMTNDNAALRGLRGQALAQLHGQNTQQAADQIGRLVNTATAQSLQAQREAPLQRIQAQSPFLQQGMTLAEDLRQRAIQNRQLASNPAILQQLTNQRFQLGTQHQENFTPGQKGGFWGGLAGGLSGAAGGLSAGAGAVNAWNSMDLSSSLRGAGNATPIWTSGGSNYDPSRIA